MALRIGLGGPGPEPIGSRRIARAVPAARAGRRVPQQASSGLITNLSAIYPIAFDHIDLNNILSRALRVQIFSCKYEYGFAFAH